MKANKAMMKIIENVNEKSNDEKISISIKEMQEFLTISIEKLYDCLILSNEKTNITEEQFLRGVSSSGSLAGYEFVNTECRMIDFFDSPLNVIEQYKIGLLYVQCLNNRLLTLTNYKIAYLFSYNDDILTIRFHQKREDEEVFFCTDINKFTEPVGILMSDELSLNIIENKEINL
ncbi:hypothetical protein UAY_02430 [Enterococcus moraviensis ATCC BAA-383]|uniref:Uncharacterized protein n=2 Tax=Enterococcus moraviensis ATCC BAA-383 TaxID=1158609 RepID=R2QSK4_9ENTE|nr:hypothetical protein [Enterococcus moraviensis]EOH98183.1 hypothetical protein UAY_02430 [Enterococcus moraviensis ATCC BAA-383]EOT71665.1 hypothetical protein I586_01472 [Enterococcus moraviensis ATCC BAA-383]